VENAIVVSNRSSSRKTVQSKQSDKKNDDMDRNGGGPVKWSSFYGRTAESFFYHPTDRNTTYHTTTILSQQAPAYDNQASAGVPSRQGLPVHQRPPQFDYLYRANESTKARAQEEVSKLVGKTAELTERRQRLEAEQAGLWCEIAFRAISHYDLDKKPLHRFEPIIPLDTASRESAESMKAATCFMALALSIIREAEKDQATTFSKIKPAIAQARQNLSDTWLRQAVDVTDRQSNEGRFAALAKRLDDVASNLSDSYVVAVEGDQANDQSRKDTFRGTLQMSLINYAQVILALDEMTSQMKDQWKIKPDVDKPIQFVGLSKMDATWVTGPALGTTSQGASATSMSMTGASTKLVSLLARNELSQWQGIQKNDDISNWSIKNGVLKLTRTGPSLRTKDVYRDFDLHLEFKLPAKNNTGVYLRGRYEVQLIDSAHRKANGEREPLDGRCGAIYKQYAPSQDVYKGPDQWNMLDVRLIDDKVTVRMNNVTIIESKMLSIVTGGAMDVNEFDPGPIVLQAHSNPGQEFRNITVKPILN